MDGYQTSIVLDIACNDLGNKSDIDDCWSELKNLSGKMLISFYL